MVRDGGPALQALVVQKILTPTALDVASLKESCLSISMDTFAMTAEAARIHSRDPIEKPYLNSIEVSGIAVRAQIHMFST